MIDRLLSDYRIIRGMNKALTITRRTGYESCFSIGEENSKILYPGAIFIGDEVSCGWENAFLIKGMARIARDYKALTGISPKFSNPDFIRFGQEEERQGRGIAAPFPYSKKDMTFRKRKILDFHTHPLNTSLQPSSADIRFHHANGGTMTIGLPIDGTHSFEKKNYFASFQLNYTDFSEEEIYHEVETHIDNISQIKCGAVMKGKILDDKLEVLEQNGIEFR